jgi:hypothetical protein
MARHHAAGWDHAPEWGQAPAWAPSFDDAPLPLRVARSRGRWLWPAVAVSGFVAVVSYVFGHDDPQPGLSYRGLLTVALAAVVVGLLTIHRAAGLGSLIRAMAEYAVVVLLAVLLATGGLGQQPATTADKASGTRDSRPRVVKAMDGVRDWLAAWWQWADQEADRRSRASSAPTPLPNLGRSRAPSPAHPTHPDRRPA